MCELALCIACDAVPIVGSIPESTQSGLIVQLFTKPREICNMKRICLFIFFLLICLADPCTLVMGRKYAHLAFVVLLRHFFFPSTIMKHEMSTNLKFNSCEYVMAIYERHHELLMLSKW